MNSLITSAERTAQLEKAIADIETAATKEAADPMNKPDGGLNAEEKSFKKRYGDLRSHASKIENDLRKQLSDAQKALDAATRKTFEMPKTAQEVSEWAVRYPEIYDTIVTIARTNAIEVNKSTDEKVAQFEIDKLEHARTKAYDQLLAAHSDFEDIKTSEQFIEWIESQPKIVYDALYVNETDSFSAIRVVDLYKSDMNYKKSPAKEKTDTRDAAREVPRGNSGSPSAGNEPEYTESKVAKMNWRRISDAEMEKIEEAMKNPAFYDLSGGAR